MPGLNGRLQLFLLGSGLCSGLCSGCGVQQRPAEKLIDPQLHSEGVLVERQRGMRDLELGRYRVEGLQIEDQPFDGTGPLAPDASGRTRPTTQLHMTFTLVGGARPWSAACIGQRRQPADHDLAAVADEQRDEVAVHCRITRHVQDSRRLMPDPVTDAWWSEWELQIEGPLTQNLLGRLDPVGGPQAEGKVVEVVMWYQLWSFTRRPLPAALAVIRGNGGSEAALILDAPERAWLGAQLDDAQRELALTAMLALRLLPLGFD
ncbi:hypothetical protein DB30_03596 [Enhygromyxa salina]|uniref:Uncharacterized protein n=1 Tax=Enhygromyxa salina TaxID=215803 RepID=A0A0C1ZH96_9BACT|nr:hypothetical protein [Enhygromyxa salina]KIG16999.1 hypothetical protein DB30_03596 [Enhygromyxa salina]